MAFDLQEQEQIDQLKTFWERGGKLVSILVLLSLLGFLGYKTYSYYKEQQSIAASQLFFQLSDAFGKHDFMQAKELSKKLKTKYQKTAYASRAAFVEAKLAFDKGDLNTAKDNLLWIEKNSNESAMKSIAILRLTAVLIDDKKYDEALNALKAQHDQEFDSQFMNLKGDVLYAKGDMKAAKSAYQEAEKFMKKNIPEYEILKIKLSALGG